MLLAGVAIGVLTCPEWGMAQSQAAQDFDTVSSTSISEPFLMVPNTDAALGIETEDGLRVVPSNTVTRPLLFLPQDVAEQANAQGALGEQAGVGEATALPAPEPEVVSNYNPRALLVTMVRLRSLAISCERILPSSPLRATDGFIGFFAQLGQALPQQQNQELSRVTDRLIPAHAAAVCQSRLNALIGTYQSLAARYAAEKQSDWPAAPPLTAQSWCGSSSCAEVR
ncbi:hypothetical protein [Tateyamaria sp. syn59]|uniref:hypothetical protein n=1 Tax=Tateyamaria sp. syn59 TaxID=2576942 RepID=UPI0011BD8D61|nr:hypothetical protein [Tateyamaria sp. syn59]